MTQQNLVAQVRRMKAAAIRRLADAEKLESSATPDSDSGYLLRLLAFEILLKALLRITGAPPIKNHSYGDLFESLPSATRARVVAVAVDRMTTGADYSSVTDLLNTFGANFNILRYPYEAYERVSNDAYHAAGEGWAQKGAPLHEAVFVYYPEELLGLTFGLQREIEAWLQSGEA